MSAALLAVDWGTSALRGALLAADGTVLAETHAARGLLHVPPGGWRAAFDATFGAWRAAHPALPCLMAGMVGSRQGWAEAPYCACPAGLDDLADALLWLEPGRLAIVPGLSAEIEQVPDVMRGEETQVFGALRLLGLRDARLVLPGTHSKWVTVQGGRITGLATHMTGEVYGLLRRQSILARTLADDDSAFVPAAFDRGLALAMQPGGLLHHAFGVRALALFDRLPPAEGASHLSGLVIGEELRAAAPRPGEALVVVGADALTQRYQRALAALGVPAHTVGASACWQGLLALAAQLPGVTAGTLPGEGPSGPGAPAPASPAP